MKRAITLDENNRPAPQPEFRTWRLTQFTIAIGFFGTDPKRLEVVAGTNRAGRAFGDCHGSSAHISIRAAMIAEDFWRARGQRSLLSEPSAAKLNHRMKNHCIFVISISALVRYARQVQPVSYPGQVCPHPSRKVTSSTGYRLTGPILSVG